MRRVPRTAQPAEDRPPGRNVSGPYGVVPWKGRDRRSTLGELLEGGKRHPALGNAKLQIQIDGYPDVAGGPIGRPCQRDTRLREESACTGYATANTCACSRRGSCAPFQTKIELSIPQSSNSRTTSNKIRDFDQSFATEYVIHSRTLKVLALQISPRVRIYS